MSSYRHRMTCAVKRVLPGLDLSVTDSNVNDPESKELVLLQFGEDHPPFCELLNDARRIVEILTHSLHMNEGSDVGSSSA